MTTLLQNKPGLVPWSLALKWFQPYCSLSRIGYVLTVRFRWLVGYLLFAFAGRGNPLTLSTARLSQDGGFGLKASSGALLVQGDATT